MAVQLDPQRFACEMATRGLLQQDLARLTGLSESAISMAARGKSISGPTFGRIAAALAAAPIIAPDGERLLAGAVGSGR